MVDLDEARVRASAQAPSTVATDVNVGLDAALHYLAAQLPARVRYRRRRSPRRPAPGASIAAIGDAVSVTTKSVEEAHGIPTPKANAEGLRTTRMAIYLARNIRLDGHDEYERERALSWAQGW